MVKFVYSFSSYFHIMFYRSIGQTNPRWKFNFENMKNRQNLDGSSDQWVGNCNHRCHRSARGTSSSYPSVTTESPVRSTLQTAAQSITVSLVLILVIFPSASSASIELGKLPSTVAAVAAKKGVVGSKPKVNIFVALFWIKTQQKHNKTQQNSSKNKKHS